MYKPKYNGPIQGWAVNYSAANAWKVSAIMELDDLLQESYMIFLKCKARYPVLEEAKHFMALYKRAFTNHVTDLAELASRSKDETDHDISVIHMTHCGETDNDGRLATLLRQAPREVQMVLNLMLNAPQELVDLTVAGWHTVDRRCTNGGAGRINAALGLDPKLNVMQMVHDYFHS